MAKHKLEELLI